MSISAIKGTVTKCGIPFLLVVKLKYRSRGGGLCTVVGLWARNRRCLRWLFIYRHGKILIQSKKKTLAERSVDRYTYTTAMLVKVYKKR